jgi:hypothetical protein
MSERDWTPTDAADAADDARARQWWKRNPYATPDYPDPDEQDDLADLASFQSKEQPL